MKRIKMSSEVMKVFVLKTDIHSPALLTELSSVFDNHVAIRQWSVDLEDADRVLRIVAIPLLSHADIIELMNMHGLSGEEMMD